MFERFAPHPRRMLAVTVAAISLAAIAAALGSPPAAAATGIATSSRATVDPPQVTYGQPVTYAIAISANGGATPITGAVTFSFGSTVLCNAEATNGTASCSASNAPGGTDTIQATYDGDGVVYDPSSTTTTLTVSVSPPAAPPGATTSQSASGVDQNGTVDADVGNLFTRGNGPGGITAATYATNPTLSTPVGATGSYMDVAVATGSNFSSVLITFCNYSVGSSLQFFDAATQRWEEFSTQEKQVGCIVVVVGATTTPSLSQLTGTPIAVSWLTAPDSSQGYWLTAADGGIFSYNRTFYGSTGNIRLNQPVVGMAPSHDDGGYWLVAKDGGIFSFGDAGYQGSLPAEGVGTDDVVGIVSDPLTNGYAVIASDGTVWDFNAPPFGDLPEFGIHENDIVGGAITPSGKGMYLVGADGKVYALAGDGIFQGDASSLHLNAPIVGMAVDAATDGYWLVGRDGGVFSYDAPFYGSAGNLRLNEPVDAMSATGDGGGYWFTAGDGGVFSYGDAMFWGSTGNIRLNQPVVTMSAS